MAVPISSTKLGTLSSPSLGQTWYQTSLTPPGVQLGSGGLLSMAISSATSADGVIFNSKEDSASVTPQLVITYR